jgi:phosphate starvation-inducible PhoH-like protein
MARRDSFDRPESEKVKFHGTPIINDKNGKVLRPITRGQQKLLEAIQENDIIFVTGPAGTGKTHIATWLGIAGIDNGEYNNLVLTRPIVEAGEELGFLPGTFDEKVGPYMQPLFDAIERVKGKRLTQEQALGKIAPEVPTSKYKKKKSVTTDTPIKSRKECNEDFYKKVNICPLAYLRGSTRDRSYIILDECQNTTRSQMKLMLTRLGYGSKMILCGDIHQSDIGNADESGFYEAMELLRGVEGVGYVHLGVNDIVRHKLVKDIIMRYEHREKDSNDDVVYSNNGGTEENYRNYRNYDFDMDDDDEESIEDVEMIDLPYDDGDITDEEFETAVAKQKD